MGTLDIIRTLAYQCVENTDVRSHLEALKRTTFQTDGPVGVEYLFHRLLNEPLKAANAKIYIILDGLNEADHDMKDQMDKGRRQIDILWKCLTTLQNCQLIVLSQPTDFLRDVPEANTISLSAKPEDIRAYMRSEMVNLQKLESHFKELKIRPEEHFVNKSDGIFLWVFLVLQQVKQSSTKTKKAIRKDLQDLFKGTGDSLLDNRFTFALMSNSDEDQEWIRPILRFLTVGIRDVTVDELEGAIETALDDERDFREFLRVPCGAFLQLQPNFKGSETVRLIHESFTMFLVDPNRCKDKKYYVDKSEAHCEITALCLDVMSSEHAEANAFLPYASSFWIDHLKHAINNGKQAVELLCKIHQFFTSDALNVWVKHGLSNVPNLSPSHIAIEESSLQDVASWIHDFRTPLNTEDSHSLINALQWRRNIGASIDIRQLGILTGKAAARVWLNEDLSDFNQIAACFALACKHCTSRSHRNPPSLADAELRQLSEYAGQPTAQAKPRNLSVAYFTSGCWDECIRWFEVAERDRDTDFKGLRYLGDAYNAKGDYNNAVKAFSSAIKKCPSDSLSYIGLAEAYKGNKDYDGAINAFRNGCEQNPDDPWFLKRLGDAYMTKRDYKSAIETFEKAIKTNDMDSWLWERLGSAFKGNNEFEKAIEKFEMAKEKFPEILRLWIMLAEAYKAKGDSDKAEETLNKAMERFPDKFVPGILPGVRKPDTLEQSSESRGTIERSVWLFTSEIAPDSQHTGPFRGWSYENWAVLVSPFPKTELESRIKASIERNSGEDWGTLHELSDKERVIRYRRTICAAKDIRLSTKAIYQGQTKMFDEELERLGTPIGLDQSNDLGDELSEYCQTYRSFTTQRQTWTKLFCSRSCSSSSDVGQPRTIDIVP